MQSFQIESSANHLGLGVSGRRAEVREKQSLFSRGFFADGDAQHALTQGRGHVGEGSLWEGVIGVEVGRVSRVWAGG